MSVIADVLSALEFAADKHRAQVRKDADGTPYINHLIQVVDTLATVGGVIDPVILIAAALHDTVEDTETSWQEIEDRFGPDVCNVVREVTDDTLLPKEERKRLQIVHAPHLSDRAKQLKLADKTCNVRDVVARPPNNWSLERRIAYLDWTEQSAEGCRGVSQTLEAHYDEVLENGRQVLSQTGGLG